MDQSEIDLRLRCVELALRYQEALAGDDPVKDAQRFYDFVTGSASAASEAAADA